MDNPGVTMMLLAVVMMLWLIKEQLSRIAYALEKKDSEEEDIEDSEEVEVKEESYFRE